MKKRDKNIEEFMLRHLGLFKRPPHQEMDLAEARIQNRLRAAPIAEDTMDDPGRAPSRWKLRRLAFALAATALAVAVGVAMQMSRTTPVAKFPEETLSPVVGERTGIVSPGEEIKAGEIHEEEVPATGLRQSTAASSSPYVAESRVAFDVVSIRPGDPYQMPPVGARGVAPAGGGQLPATGPGADPALVRTLTCSGPRSALDVNPGRMVLRNGTVYRLIVLGYGLKDCILSLQMGLVPGGPDWVRTERFDVEATIPAGSSAYTRQQLTDGEAPRLQAMIQTLLAERFNLVLLRETKDLPAYNLVVARAGRIKAAEDQTPPPPLAAGTFISTNPLPRGVMLNCTGNAIRLLDLAKCLQKSVSATIVDKTNLKGLYDIPVFTPDPAFPGLSPDQMLETLGLKLEPTKAPGEVLTIKRVERPTEN